ncbi:hypothetical protein GN156_32060 [bacterium LRH843]|uniref:hypothetical protein n=1 Tax=Marinobacter salinexigens TaxID=2919747 RepID=UPI0013CAB182|nr:hypothetical protein [Marinobacter salinexigens]NEU35290.1 hypothetical protein [bacterium LRH843]
MKAFVSLIVLLGVGASFIGSLVCLFSGQFLPAIGLFFFSAVLNGVARSMGA